MFLFHLVVTLGLFIGLTEGSGEWDYSSYGSSGPSTWAHSNRDCGGVMQSPINIDTWQTLHDPNLENFDFSGYQTTSGVTMTLENKGGHTVQVSYSGTPIMLRGGNLPADYQLDQFHFHWGTQNSRGSEHSLDRTHYPMEMHLVHHQASITCKASQAQHPYGLAVIGFFFQVAYEHNSMFDQLLNYLTQVAYPDNKTTIPTFSVSDLLPSGAKRHDHTFYRYYGSLTTPPCYESVIWSISSDVISISQAQLDKFRALYKDSHGNRMGDNYRPLQERNGRTVLRT